MSTESISSTTDEIVCPPSPYDHDIELLIDRQGQWTDADVMRGWMIIDLYSSTESPDGPTFSPAEQNRMCDLWWDYLGEFTDAFNSEPVTGPLGLVAKLKLVISQLGEGDDYQRIPLESALAFADTPEKISFTLPVPPCASRIWELLTCSSAWDDECIAEAGSIWCKSKAWVYEAMKAFEDHPAEDTIFELLLAPLDFLDSAIEIAPAQGIPGIAAKLDYLTKREKLGFEGVDKGPLVEALLDELRKHTGGSGEPPCPPPGAPELKEAA